MHNLSLKSISYKYSVQEPYIFRNVTLQLNHSQNVLLVGENGSGKSTLGLLVCGLIQPSIGNVTINGVDIHKLKPKNRIQYAYYIPQDNQLQFIRNTLKEEIRLSQRLVNKKNNDPDLYSEYRILSNISTHPLDLSVNECWRFSLLLASIISPIVLFIDEIPSWSNNNNKTVLSYLLKQRKLHNYITIFSFQRILEIPIDRIMLIGDETVYGK